LTVGACVSLTDIAENALVRGGWPAFAIAAGKVATPQLRNMGTVGGNLCLDTRCNYYDQNYEWRRAISFCMKAPGTTDGRACTSPDGSSLCWVATSSPRCWAVSSTDTAPALIALGAEVTLVGPGGERRIPLETLYRNDGMAYLAKAREELLTRVHLAAPDPYWKSTYWKLRRRGSFDFPVLGVAAALRLREDGAGRPPVVEAARVALGAVASQPVLLAESTMLVGQPLSDDLMRAFAEAAAKHARPMDNTDFELSWRKKVTRSFVTGALQELRGDPVRRP
jgi:4-hydroxybenzoyl-CoA reductase subunit beta